MEEFELIGQSIDQYRILSFLGEGGLARVFKAQHQELGRIVAIKVIHRSLRLSKDASARFLREGKILCSLSHERIVKCYSYGVSHEGVPYLVFEYLNGENLRHVLDKGRLSWEDAVSISICICEGLEYAHVHSIVHRDLKPENIMFQDFAHVKILDFGLAALTCKLPDEHATKMTQSGALIGTVNYMSPEQSKGHKADSQSDIYSLGCILYELVVGNPPHLADNPMGVLYKHVNETVRAPGNFVENLPAGFDQVVLKALAKDRAKRYNSVSQFHNDLDLILARKAPLAGCPLPESQRSPTRLFLLSLTIMLVFGTLLCVSRHISGLKDKDKTIASTLKKNVDTLVSFSAQTTFERIVYLHGSGNEEQAVDLARRWLKKYLGKADQWFTARILMELAHLEFFSLHDQVSSRLHFLESLKLMEDLHRTNDESFFIALINLAEVEAISNPQSGRKRLLEALNGMNSVKGDWVDYNKVRALRSLARIEVIQLNNVTSGREKLLEALQLISASTSEVIRSQQVDVVFALGDSEQTYLTARERFLEALRLTAESEGMSTSHQKRAEVLCSLGRLEATSVIHVKSGRERLLEALRLIATSRESSELVNCKLKVLCILGELELYSLNDYKSASKRFFEVLKYHSAAATEATYSSVACGSQSLRNLALIDLKLNNAKAGCQRLIEALKLIANFKKTTGADFYYEEVTDLILLGNIESGLLNDAPSGAKRFLKASMLISNSKQNNLTYFELYGKHTLESLKLKGNGVGAIPEIDKLIEKLKQFKT